MHHKFSLVKILFCSFLYAILTFSHQKVFANDTVFEEVEKHCKLVFRACRLITCNLGQYLSEDAVNTVVQKLKLSLSILSGEVSTLQQTVQEKRRNQAVSEKKYQEALQRKESAAKVIRELEEKGLQDFISIRPFVDLRTELDELNSALTEAEAERDQLTEDLGKYEKVFEDFEIIHKKLNLGWELHKYLLKSRSQLINGQHSLPTSIADAIRKQTQNLVNDEGKYNTPTFSSDALTELSEIVLVDISVPTEISLILIFEPFKGLKTVIPHYQSSLLDKVALEKIKENISSKSNVQRLRGFEILHNNFPEKIAHTLNIEGPIESSVTHYIPTSVEGELSSPSHFEGIEIPNEFNRRNDSTRF